MIGFVGLTHLGIVMSLATAAKGFEVVAFDPDAGVRDAVGRGEFPIVEPGLVELYERARPRLRVAQEAGELKGCRLIFVSPDTPWPGDQGGRGDLSVVDHLATLAATHAEAGAVLVLLSQVPPGHTRRLASKLREETGGRMATLYCQVETLVFGRAVERAMQPQRIIVGCERKGVPLHAVYAEVLEGWGCPILTMPYESAEMAKIAVNVLLAASVTATNTLAELCEAVGADWADVAPAIKVDSRIGGEAYVAPGLGIGGGNLERDLATVDWLAREHGTDAGLVGACFENSRYRRDWVLRHLRAAVLSQSPDELLAVWGLAYKANTASTRNSPALALLGAIAPLRARAYDPRARLPRELAHVGGAGSPIEACSGATALAVMTPWPEFAAVPLVQVRDAMSGRTILDPFGVLDAEGARALGFAYFRLGSPVAADGRKT